MQTWGAVYEDVEGKLLPFCWYEGSLRLSWWRSVETSAKTKRESFTNMDYLNPDMDEWLHPLYIMWEEITYPFPSLNGAF